MRWLLILVFVSLILAPAAEAGRQAFVDPVTGELKSHGFAERNESGDLAVPVPDEFRLAPGRWRWTGSAWQPYAKPAPPPSELSRAIDALLADPVVNQRIKDAFQRLKERLEP